MTSTDPLACEKCGGDLESDDAISIIEGVCDFCRRQPSPSAHPSPEARMNGPDADDLALSAILDQLAAAGPPDPASRSALLKAGRAAPGIHPPAIPVVASPACISTPPRSRRRARDLTIGALIGLMLTTAATAYFILTRESPSVALAEAPNTLPQSLPLRVIPAWAKVKLGNRVLDSADAAGRMTLTLSEQERWSWLEVTAEGYHSDRRPLATLGGAGEVCIELVRGPYEVSIQTTPDQSEVWIDNKLKGYSPLTMSLLPHERPTLSIKRRGYEEISQTLAPPERRSQLALNLTLTPRGAMVRVETDPAGAAISAAGEPQGDAPRTLQLDPSLLGKEVLIAAAAPGYDTAETRLTLPTLAVHPLEPVRLTLQRTRIDVEISTDPPGGTIRLDGRALGAAPVIAEFDSTQIGRTVVVQAALAGSYHGRQELTVPPAGQSTRVTIPMAFNAGRVVFVMAPSRDAPSDGRALSDRLIDLIHDLTPQQRFALVANADAGPESWPSDGETEAATSEQKVRAYDFARSWRPLGSGRLREALEDALAFEPTTIWLLTADGPDQADLASFDAALRGADVAVHIVSLTPSVDDELTAGWTARHNGTYTSAVHQDPVASGESHAAE